MTYSEYLQELREKEIKARLLYPSKELCLKLKEAGFKQSTAAAYYEDSDKMLKRPPMAHFDFQMPPNVWNGYLIAAPTIMEMIEWLTEKYTDISFSLHFQGSDDGRCFFVNYDDTDIYILTLPILNKYIADEFAQFVLNVITEKGHGK